MAKLTGEPSLNSIDDYLGTESKEKRRNVYLIMAGLIIVSVGGYIYRIKDLGLI